MTDKKPPFVMVVVSCGILFTSRPSDKQVLETFAEILRDGELKENVEILRFDISDDVHGTIAEKMRF